MKTKGNIRKIKIEEATTTWKPKTKKNNVATTAKWATISRKTVGLNTLKGVLPNVRILKLTLLLRSPNQKKWP